VYIDKVVQYIYVSDIEAIEDCIRILDDDDDDITITVMINTTVRSEIQNWDLSHRSRKLDHVLDHCKRTTKGHRDDTINSPRRRRISSGLLTLHVCVSRLTFRTNKIVRPPSCETLGLIYKTSHDLSLFIMHDDGQC